MQIQRSLRDQQVRAVSNRSGEIRPIDPRSSGLDIDLGPDVKLRLVRKFITGKEEDPQAFYERRDSGYVPVDPSEIPAKYKHMIVDGMLMKDGCILCKIDASTAAGHQAFWENKALGLENGARQEFGRGGVDSRMPRFEGKDNKQRIIKGQKPNG